MQQSITIQKNEQLSDSANYALLRQKGLEYIQQLGSALWTDYNVHDPGITILEALCYAITDLGYRTAYNIEDLLAPPPGQEPDAKRQGFFTAREILTVNPWTIADFRKLLIDVEGIKNAWLHCKQCPCNSLYLYANCKESKLQYEPTEHPIIIKGLYDVLVEFDDDDRSGNLNSGRIKYNFTFDAGGAIGHAVAELRLPAWQLLNQDALKYKGLREPDSIITKVTVNFISGNPNDNQDLPLAKLTSLLRNVLYATLTVQYKPSPASPVQQLVLEDVPLRIWLSSDSQRKMLTLEGIKQALSDSSKSGIMARYLEKIKRADAVMDRTMQVLHSHRNLCEDYCTVLPIAVEDFAVCADMEVRPDADIEKVLAEAYYLIDNYFSPEIQFQSLQQLLNTGRQPDEIFEGPALSNGFIDNEQLATTHLKRVLYTSDIYNLLMDIDGVVAVKNLVLTKYDAAGNSMVPSQPWSIEVGYQKQPRLYIEASKFLVYKNGLPFLPDASELYDTLQVIKGQHVQPKFAVLENDLPIPAGGYANVNEYFPVQNALPQTYGIGYAGLPDSAPAERKAQAKQLKAYLLFFEQLLVNYLSQLSHTADLFALDDTVTHTYFSTFIQDEITGLQDSGTEKGLYKGLDAAKLAALSETDAVFLDRRNRFLDHLMARFSEQFSDYALMLYAYADSKAIVDEELIKDKIAFVKDLPFMSANRARSFNYKEPAAVCQSNNVAGLSTRIRRLLGLPDNEKIMVVEHLLLRPRNRREGIEAYMELYEEKDADGVFYERRWRLKDAAGKIYLSGSTRYPDPLLSVAESKARQEIAVVKKYITDVNRYTIKKGKQWYLNLTDETGEVIATRKQHFATEQAAQQTRDGIIAFANSTKTSVPVGDALLPICIPPDCSLCGDEDPYSFRLTIVLNGEEGIPNKSIDFRRFAEHTIRMEAPAHLGLKICWVSTRQLALFEKIYCDWLKELSKKEPDKIALSNKLHRLICLLGKLRNVYPPASLHDCVDGNDENRVYLNQTII